jgi:tRNA dimethylallyltransferase
VGGTGLYIKALIDGLSIVPDIPDDIRRTVQESRNALGAEGFYTHVAEKDPIAAQNLSKTDTYRQMRALEVILATGRSIMEWRANKTRHENFQFKTILLLPNRTGLYERINQRFDAMLRAGVLAEVEALGHGEMPAFKAVGAAELRAYLDGMMTIEQATDIAKQNSRRLAKRQFTWFRHQLVPDLILTDFLNDVDHLVEYF